VSRLISERKPVVQVRLTAAQRAQVAAAAAQDGRPVSESLRPLLRRGLIDADRSPATGTSGKRSPVSSVCWHPAVGCVRMLACPIL